MFILKYRVKKKCSGNYRRFYTILKPMIIIFKTREKSGRKNERHKRMGKK